MPVAISTITYTSTRKDSSDEEFVWFAHAFILEFIDCNQYIFDSRIKKKWAGLYCQAVGTTVRKTGPANNTALEVVSKTGYATFLVLY
jgi:hypothetical protein